MRVIVPTRSTAAVSENLMDEREPHVRRQGPRFELARDVVGEAEYRAGIHLIDLSTTGALVELHRFAKPGQELLLQVPLEEDTLTVRASVIHCSAQGLRRRGGPAEAIYRAGVRFVDLSDQGIQLIQDLIIERLQNERREQPRLYVGRAAELREAVELRAVNLGKMGGLFTVGHPLECGREYDIVFRVPSGEVRARVVVRHCQVGSRQQGEPSFQVGVQFVSLSKEGRQRVFDYLASLETSANRHEAF